MSWADVVETAKDTIRMTLGQFFDIRMTDLWGGNYTEQIYQYCERKLSKNSESKDTLTVKDIRTVIINNGIEATNISNFDISALNHLIRFSDFQDEIFDVFPQIEKEILKGKIRDIVNCRNAFSHETSRARHNYTKTIGEEIVYINEFLNILSPYPWATEICKGNYEKTIRAWLENLEREMIVEHAKLLPVNDSFMGDSDSVVIEQVQNIEKNDYDGDNEDISPYEQEQSKQKEQVLATVKLTSGDRPRSCMEICEECGCWFRPDDNSSSQIACMTLCDCCKGDKAYQEKNYNEAIQFYKTDIENESSSTRERSFTMIGKCFYYGNGFKKNYAASIKWFRRAAETGSSEAEYYLALCYFFGKGIIENKIEAAQLFEKASLQGHIDATLRLANSYYNGIGVVQDFAKAAELLTVAANKGNEIAQFWLGECYIMGNGVIQDSAEAVKWFLAAANQRYTRAFEELGYCFFYGRGTEQNYVEAVEFFRMAAEKGLMNSQFFLGCCYLNGNGISQDVNKAKKWLKKAAVQGHLEAKRLLHEQFTER